MLNPVRPETSAMPAPTPNPAKLFDSLVINAFDFINEAVGVFKRSPKLSAIHFFTAMELLLKARLVREHWSLLFMRLDDATVTRLSQGDFQSVGLKDAYKRLTEIAHADFPQPALEAFEALRKRRNQLVHFYAPAKLSGPKSPARLAIIREQCRAWHYLYELLTRHWKSHFNRHAAAIVEAARQMRRHKDYLCVRFTELQPVIKTQLAGGAKQHRCYVCDQKALIEQAGVGPVQPAKCLVCENVTTILTTTCSCTKTLVFKGEGFGSCKCGLEYTPESLADLLHNDNYNPADGEESSRATCTHCECFECKSVVPFNGTHLCTNCLAVWDDSKIGKCGYCGDLYAGEIEDSYLSGCPNCDGHLAHLAAKDD